MSLLGRHGVDLGSNFPRNEHSLRDFPRWDEAAPESRPSNARRPQCRSDRCRVDSARSRVVPALGISLARHPAGGGVTSVPWMRALPILPPRLARNPFSVLVGRNPAQGFVGRRRPRPSVRTCATSSFSCVCAHFRQMSMRTPNRIFPATLLYFRLPAASEAVLAPWSVNLFARV